MKIQKSIKHDSLYLKLVDGKDWVRLSIGRGGWKITGCGDSMRGVAEKVKSLFQEAMAAKMVYADALDYVESELVAA